MVQVIRMKIRYGTIAVYTCLMRKWDRLEVIRDFSSLNPGVNPFSVDGSIAEQK
jgi:hypothetical protein